MYLRCTELGNPAQHAGQSDPATAVPHCDAFGLFAMPWRD